MAHYRGLTHVIDMNENIFHVKDLRLGTVIRYGDHYGHLTGFAIGACGDFLIKCNIFGIDCDLFDPEELVLYPQ